MEVDERFAGYRKLTVRQTRRWREREFTRQNYFAYDQDQRKVLRVEEQTRGFRRWVERLVFKAERPYELMVVDADSEAPLLRLVRPSRTVLHRVEVSTPSREPLGAVQRRWSWKRRLYLLEDVAGDVLAELHGGFFVDSDLIEVKLGGEVRATIRRQSKGLLHELVHDNANDIFDLDLAQLETPRLKVLALAAALLIDAVHFQGGAG